MEDAEIALKRLCDSGDQARGGADFLKWEGLSQVGEWWTQYAGALVTHGRPTANGWRLLRAALTTAVSLAQVTQQIPAPVADWVIGTIVPLLDPVPSVEDVPSADVTAIRQLVNRPPPRSVTAGGVPDDVTRLCGVFKRTSDGAV